MNSREILSKAKFGKINSREMSEKKSAKINSRKNFFPKVSKTTPVELRNRNSNSYDFHDFRIKINNFSRKSLSINEILTFL